MAKDAKPEAEVAAAAPKKGKKLLIIIAVALVLFVALGIGGAIVWKKMNADGDGEEAEVTTVKADKKKGAKDSAPVYVALDQFTVNLVPDNGEQFLQIMISVEVSDLHVGDRLKSYTPKLRNNVMLLLSGKKAAELISKGGKEALANEIRDLINEILEPGAKAGQGPVKEVLFTSFIIQ